LYNIYKSNKMNILELKNNFNDIKNIRESSINLMKSLGDKIETLKIIYNELIENNLDETDTGLDSFHFQTKLINLELENYQKTFKIIDNRIYGDYYKLFKKVTKFLKDNEYILTLNKNIIQQYENKDYEVFKDLNNIQDYDINNTSEIFNDIIQVIDILHNELMEREHKLELQKIKQQSGLNIDTLISKVKYNNKYLNNHILLFNENIEIFNSFHKKYLIRFLLKTKLFYGQINIDIKLEESKNSIDYKLEEQQNIILEGNEEDDIRNLINNTHDNLNKENYNDTNNNIMNELNCMISSISDTSSTGSSPGKNEKHRANRGISSSFSELEIHNKNEIDKIIENNIENNNNNDNNNDNDNDNEKENIEYDYNLNIIQESFYYRTCTII